MANRYTTLAPTTFDNIQLYQPNYEGLDLLLGQQQQRKDLAEASIDALMPDALSQFQPQADEYYQGWREKIDKLPDLYAKSFREGNKELNTLIKDAKRELQDPNSEYSHFANTKKQYLEGVKRIEEFHAKDPIKYNKEWAMNQLNNQLSGATWDKFYDKSTQRVIKGFQDPELTPYVDIQKDVIEGMKNIQLNQDTEFTDWLKPDWIQKIKIQEITPELVAEVTNQMLDNPKYKDQLNIEKWYQTRGIDYDQEAQKYKQNLVIERENLFNTLDNLSTADSNTIAAYQQELGATPDGVYGNETKAAIEKYKANYDKEISNQLSDPNFQDNLKNKIENDMARDPYINMAKKMFARKIIDKDLIVDQPALTRMKIAASRSNTQALVRGIESLVPKEETDVLVTPYVGWTHATWEQDKKVASDALTQADTHLNNLVSNPTIQDIFMTKTNIPGVLGLGNIIPYSPMSKDEIANAVWTATEINKLDIPLVDKVAMYSKKTGVPIEKADMQFNEITVGTVGRTFGEAYNAQNEANQNLTRMNQVEASLLDTYYKNEGKDELTALKKSNGWTNKSDSEVTELVKESLKYSNVWKDKSGNYYGRQAGTNKDVRIDNTKGANLAGLYQTQSVGTIGTTITNKAAGALKNAEKHISKNPEYAKSTRSFDVRGGKDTQLAQYLDLVNERLNNPAEITGLIQELSGGADFTFRDLAGNKIDFAAIKPGNMKADFITKPTGGVLAVQGLSSDGKTKVYQEFKIPETHKYVVKKAIMEMGIKGFENDDPIALETAANHWAMENGAYTNLPIFQALEPVDKPGVKTTPIRFVPNASRPNERIEFKTYSDPLVYRPEPNGRSYNIHLVKTPEGKKAYIASIRAVGADGVTRDVIVPFPGKDAGNAHTNVEDLISNINKQEMPNYFDKQVVLEKLPTGIQGGYLDNKQTAALVTGIGAFNNMGSESESFSIETEE